MSHLIPASILIFEVQSDSRTREIRIESPADRAYRAIEQQLLDPNVIIKVFDVAHELRHQARMEGALR